MVKDDNLKIGLIAGSGNFPRLFAEAARDKGYEVYAVAYVQAAEPDLEKYVKAVKWLHLGEIESLLKFFSKFDINQTVIMGGVKKTRMFSDIKPDAKALALIGSLAETHDDLLLRGFANLLEENGLIVRDSTFLLPDILATEGCWTVNRPGTELASDIALGWKVAKEIGRLDIGQCVVVESGTILAVEAIDGTDATIARGASLGGGQAVVVKVCKPDQDRRFDIPAVGVDTICTMRQSGARTLIIEAGQAVVFDRVEMIALANESGISIVAQKGNQKVNKIDG